MIPDITTSTKEEREKYIKDNYYCRSNCDICGMCKVFRGKSPEVIFKDYIDGKESLKDILKNYI